MITLKNGLIISEDKDGFESFNHLTSKIDPKSFTKFSELPDIFYKELGEDDKTQAEPNQNTCKVKREKGVTTATLPP